MSRIELWRAPGDYSETSYLQDIALSLRHIDDALVELLRPRRRREEQRREKAREAVWLEWAPFVERGLPMRACNSLVRNELTPAQVREMPDNELRYLRNVGAKTLRDIRSALAE